MERTMDTPAGKAALDAWITRPEPDLALQPCGSCRHVLEEHAVTPEVCLLAHCDCEAFDYEQPEPDWDLLAEAREAL